MGFNVKRLQKNLTQTAEARKDLEKFVGQVINAIIADFDQQDDEVVGAVGRVLNEHKSRLIHSLLWQGRYSVRFTPNETPTEDYLARFEFIFMKSGVIRVGAKANRPDGTEIPEGRVKDFHYISEGH